MPLRPILRSILALAVSIVAGTSPAHAQPCAPQWAEGLFCIEGLNDRVRAAVAFDDGAGEKIYVGGDFTISGCEIVNHIAVWDGTRWTGLEGPGGVGVDRGVEALAVYDDGSGPALYVGGSFRTAGGVAAANLARWDGSRWSAVEGASGTTARSSVQALHVGDDGSGVALFAGTRLDSAPGSPLGVARWDGSDWTMVLPAGGSGFERSPGIGGSILAIDTFDDGSGPALYAGGAFETVGGVLANNIARWDGAAWVGLRSPGGGTGTDGIVYALEAYDDGRGEALYVGGFFREFDRGDTANFIARWDGAAWETLDGPSGTGTNNAVFALTTFDDGQGEHLYAGGQFFSAGGVRTDVARWDGAQWSAPPGDVRSDLDGRVYALATWDGGDGSALFMGGDFGQIDTVGALSAARLRQGSGWEGFAPIEGNGLYAVSDLLVRREGGQDALYAAAGAYDASGEIRSIMARWTGDGWDELVSDDGVGITSASAMIDFDDGTGDALYLAGQFVSTSGARLGTVARWSGSRWEQLLGPGGGSPAATIRALGAFDDGGGAAIYVAGSFVEADGQTVNGITKWDGTAYRPLVGPAGTGVNGEVRSLAVFDDGNGPALYVTGSFTEAGGVPAAYIARWDGLQWSSLAGPMGEGLSGEGWGLAVFDDGTGPSLYVGGRFDAAGGVDVDNIARWDGATWTPLAAPGGVGVRGRIGTLEAIVDGEGPALYAGGGFDRAGGRFVQQIARWDGQDWSSLDGPRGVGINRQVDDIAGVVEQGRVAIYAGGISFTVAGGVVSRSIARYACVEPSCPADLDGDGELNIFDFLAFQNAFDAMDPVADFDGDGAFTLFDFLAFQNAFDAGCA